MTTYRTLWLGICVQLGVIGAAVALVRSPMAMALLLAVYGGIGGLLAMGLHKFWEEGAVGRLRLLAAGAVVAGTSIGAFIGYASFLGPGVILLAAAVLAGSPSAVATSGRWIRSVRTLGAAEPDAAGQRADPRTWARAVAARSDL